MYKRILVPLDGSPLAERALASAGSLAKATGARLGLVRAAWSADVVAGVADQQIEALDEADAYLRTVAGRLKEQGVVAHTFAIPWVRPAEGILSEITREHADLVVMSTHGRSGLGRWIYGSVAEEVLAGSPIPILLVRAAGSEPSYGVEGSRPQVVVPLDGSTFAEAALPHAVALAGAFHGGIVLLQVVTIPQVSTSSEIGLPDHLVDFEEVRQAEENAHAYLNRVAHSLRTEGIAIRTVVRSGWPAAEINEEERMTDGSLTVMASHGRTGLGRLLFGSVAIEVLHRGTRPVLLVGPKALHLAAATEPREEASAR